MRMDAHGFPYKFVHCRNRNSYACQYSISIHVREYVRCTYHTHSESYGNSRVMHNRMSFLRCSHIKQPQESHLRHTVNLKVPDVKSTSSFYYVLHIKFDFAGSSAENLRPPHTHMTVAWINSENENMWKLKDSVWLTSPQISKCYILN